MVEQEDSRKRASVVHHESVRVGDRLAVRLTGAHARINLGEEFDKAKRMGDRPTFEVVYVRKNRHGVEVIEKYLPDQGYEVQPDDRIPGRDGINLKER